MVSLNESILSELALGPRSAAELMSVLGVSQPTISRASRELVPHQVLRLGSTRGARYARRRTIDRIGSEWPVFRVDEEGAPHELGTLNAIQRNGYFVTAEPERIRGLFDDSIPYFLQDARPAGFLGRAVPAAFPELGLPPRVIDWTDEHFLVYLTQRASDSPGDLIVGAESLNRYLSATHDPPVVLAGDRSGRYPELAAAAMAGAPPGSSAQGEYPKFTACMAEGDRRSQLIVKFSPPRSTPTGQRWADLLIAEYTAHRVLEEHGTAASQSNLLEYADRVFLEIQRFDRIGADGRRGVVSLFAVDTARYGVLDSWTASAQRLADDSLLSQADTQRIRFLDAFGALIANTDRHFGNISLFDQREGPLRLAPAYDMLPMLFAPQDDQIVPREFEPGPATAAWLSVWTDARACAENYWDRLADEPRLSAEFRGLCSRNLAAIRAMPRRGAPQVLPRGGRPPR
jgi:HipA-like C-terminal domain/Bacterial regulatory protein, arsR family